MIKCGKKIDSEQAMAAARRSVNFWATIDGDKLAKVGFKEKEMDLVGREISPPHIHRLK